VAKKEPFIINVRPSDSIAFGRPRGVVGWVLLLATLIVVPTAVAVDVPLPRAPEAMAGGAPPEPVAVFADTNRVLGTRTLRIGAVGRDVREFEAILRRRGFKITVDGAFGVKTRKAVMALQKRFKMRQTGVVGAALLKRLGIKVRDVRSGTPATPATPVDSSNYPLAGPNAATAAYLKAFPVAGKHTYSNDYGAPRSQGGHQGNDIMAARGVPVRAVAGGTIKRLTRTETGLGGIWIWLKDTRGDEYYFAHLNSITEGLDAGTTVTVGQVIGTVGNTGDARYGATHLHFEVHPGGGSAVNPYTDLRAVDPEPPSR
jgi:murein DD-endopeptidase MepM/ murein hydrolase activator NlpD